VFNELVVRLFGGASLALLLLAGLSTSARVVANEPDGWVTCSAVCSRGCPQGLPCPSDACGCPAGYNCFCREWAEQESCPCAL
jgi:hypothetical protein